MQNQIKNGQARPKLIYLSASILASSKKYLFSFFAIVFIYLFFLFTYTYVVVTIDSNIFPLKFYRWP